MSTILLASIIYASEITILCIGFTLTYLTAKIPNFAHGTYAGMGIYIAYTFSEIMNVNVYLSFPFAFIFGGIFSMLIYKLVIGVATSTSGSDVVVTISTLAIQILLTSFIYIYAYWLRAKFSTYATGFMLKNKDFQFAGLPGIFYFATVLCMSTVILLHFFLNKTKTGIAMRAITENPELASIVGINTYRMQLLSWFLTGGLACLAGAMLPMWFMSDPTTGTRLMTSIMAGSLLGGFNTIYGSIVGGFIVGLSEIWVTRYLQDFVGIWVGEYRPLIPLIILVSVLLTEPKGMQGLYERLKYLNKE